MTMKQDRMGLADVLVTPRLAAWLVASPTGDAALLGNGSMSGQDIVALGLLGGATPVLHAAPAFDAEIELPFIRPEAAKGRSLDEDEDEDEEDEDAADEDEDEEEEDEDLDEDEDEDDDDDDDEDEDEDDDDFLDDDEDDDYDDDEDDDDFEEEE